MKIDCKKLSNLTFADDLVLISENYEELKKITIELDESSKEAGLEINILKTNFMSNGKMIV